ncbi:hypothetical protein TNCV_5108111 [Trichonephila clavipes]|nr:hypothetical protein TNCV_5108111 [Trichonephila clavipes]
MVFDICRQEGHGPDGALSGKNQWWLGSRLRALDAGFCYFQSEIVQGVREAYPWGLMRQIKRKSAIPAKSARVSQVHWDKLLRGIGDITRIQICLTTHGRKRLHWVLGGVVQKS